MSKLSVGDKAPAFKALDGEGNMHTLAESRGSWVMLYFYPKDDTPGCTVEACTIRDNFPKFKKLGVRVFGVSVDTAASHAKFSKKYKLPFTLLADPEKKIVTAYGVWGMKKFLGREYMGTRRMSFLIDPRGRIAKIYETVKPPTHAEEVLRDLNEQIQKV